MDSQATKINVANWLQVFDSKNNDMYPYEPNSVMHYGSYALSNVDPKIPTMTYKDGSTFDEPLDYRITTTDSLQVIWAYCNDDADKGNPKETVSCPSVDQVGYTRPVYVDRLCDGRLDCHNGEDESGSLAKCIPESLIETGGSAGCCESYIVKSPHSPAIEYKYEEGTYSLTHGNWVNSNNSSQLIFRIDIDGPLKGMWIHSVSGKPENGIAYSAFSNEVNPINSACPPTDSMWTTGNGINFSVICKSSGPEINDIQKCQDAKCDPVATCTDTSVGFSCKCPPTHYAVKLFYTKETKESKRPTSSFVC